MSTEHLPAGRYRLTMEIETDGHGFLYPHDTAAMTMLDWWAARGARFEPVPPPQCNECGWWLTTNPTSCPSCGTPTGLGVSGGDRSEPVPAPDVFGESEPEGVTKVRDRLAYVWTHNDRNGLWYASGQAPRTWSSLWMKYGPLSPEVVTPEGTP